MKNAGLSCVGNATVLVLKVSVSKLCVCVCVKSASYLPRQPLIKQKDRLKGKHKQSSNMLYSAEVHQSLRN